MEIIIKCADDVRGGTNIYGEPIRELVRCKECKHNPWNYDAEKPLEYTCIWDDDFADREQTPNDFCSYGERKGE